MHQRNTIRVGDTLVIFQNDNGIVWIYTNGYDNYFKTPIYPSLEHPQHLPMVNKAFKKMKKVYRRFYQEKMNELNGIPTQEEVITVNCSSEETKPFDKPKNSHLAIWAVTNTLRVGLIELIATCREEIRQDVITCISDDIYFHWWMHNFQDFTRTLISLAESNLGSYIVSRAFLRHWKFTIIVKYNCNVFKKRMPELDFEYVESLKLQSIHK